MVESCEMGDREILSGGEMNGIVGAQWMLTHQVQSKREDVGGQLNGEKSGKMRKIIEKTLVSSSLCGVKRARKGRIACQLLRPSSSESLAQFHLQYSIPEFWSQQGRINDHCACCLQISGKLDTRSTKRVCCIRQADDKRGVQQYLSWEWSVGEGANQGGHYITSTVNGFQNLFYRRFVQSVPHRLHLFLSIRASFNHHQMHARLAQHLFEPLPTVGRQLLQPLSDLLLRCITLSQTRLTVLQQKCRLDGRLLYVVVFQCLIVFALWTRRSCL